MVCEFCHSKSVKLKGRSQIAIKDAGLLLPLLVDDTYQGPHRTQNCTGKHGKFCGFWPKPMVGNSSEADFYLPVRSSFQLSWVQHVNGRLCGEHRPLGPEFKLSALPSTGEQATCWAEQHTVSCGNFQLWGSRFCYWGVTNSLCPLRLSLFVPKLGMVLPHYKFLPGWGCLCGALRFADERGQRGRLTEDLDFVITGTQCPADYNCTYIIIVINARITSFSISYCHFCSG